MSRYKQPRKGAGNPSPTAAHEANRKGSGRTRVQVNIDKDLLELIDQEKAAQVLAQWDSRSDIINYGLALVAEEIQASKDMEAADANRQVERF
jgi:MoxR-like ATPase